MFVANVVVPEPRQVSMAGEIRRNAEHVTDYKRATTVGIRVRKKTKKKQKKVSGGLVSPADPNVETVEAFAQEFRRILLNSESAANDLVKLTILANEIKCSMALEAKLQTERANNLVPILKNVDQVYGDPKSLLEILVENSAKLDQKMGVMEERLNEISSNMFQLKREIKDSVQGSIQNEAGRFEQAVISAFLESDILKTVIENSARALLPNCSYI
ncbi:hypothetical protein FANTH_7016 [Fusarium anthophilum]|uniref:Uncharacterized protein n=1 Tax=Fusarium anthophilum TaxID=48485 RepID=A0A8H5E3N1_9HYPO|nr:hypothetical protein FANTH_7016 [Fusarium anthophilum]